MSQRVIAIDGPAASGKSTVAKRVAAELGFIYVDSGSLYRGMAWQVLQEDVEAGDASAVANLAQGTEMEFFVVDDSVRFRIEGKDPGEEIRSQAVNSVVSPVAAVPEVRRKVVSCLRNMTRFGNLVMEGRDIGTAVFPETDHKFYLDASAAERARRRHAETDEKVSVEQVGDSLQQRDNIDSTRKMDPLKIAPGAEVVDTTSMTIEEVVRRVITRVNSARGM